MIDVFGSVRLGYLVVETNRLTDWKRFGADAIGLHVDELTTDVTRFRLDDHTCRFLLQRGPAEDVTTFGWQVTTHEAFDEILSRVTARRLPQPIGLLLGRRGPGGAQPGHAVLRPARWRRRRPRRDRR